MKQTLLILSLFAFCAASAQKIHFSDTSNKWHWYYYACGGDEWVRGAVTNSFSGDTVVHGLAYKKLAYGEFGNWSALVREDTIMNKVFAIKPYDDTDTLEKVLYDYNLQTGDTFVTRYTSHKVDSTDSVMINGAWHKVWYLSNILPAGIPWSNFIGYTFIEGIGCQNEPLFPLYPYFFEQCVTLTCFDTRGTTPPLSHKVGYYFDNASSCSLTFGVGVQDVKHYGTKVQVVPNPVTAESRLILPGTIKSGTLIVVNSVGQVLINRKFENKEELLIGNLPFAPGIYFYHITNNENGSVYSGKFAY